MCFIIHTCMLKKRLLAFSCLNILCSHAFDDTQNYFSVNGPVFQRKSVTFVVFAFFFSL